jgi:hypothetical protein
MQQAAPGSLAALLLVLTVAAEAQFTTTYVADLVCVRDLVYTSLSKEGKAFCESVIDESCETLSKPAAYSGLGDEEISSYVRCPFMALTLIRKRWVA